VQYHDLDNIVGTTGQVFSGLTVNCAQCRDHKLDPNRLTYFYGGLNQKLVGVEGAEPIHEIIG
jgi:hypothetical protein